MNTKQLIALSALALAASAASAQTVPAEAWVGAPIARTAGALSRAEVQTELARSQTVARAPQEAWAGSAAGEAVAAGALSRAEVQADLALWTRAGLDQYALRDSVDRTSPDFRQRSATYEQSRQSAAYTAEVQRLQGAPAVASSGAGASGAN
ncbi:hypothetical protein M2165_001184 [Variovorax sp. TBS-050B]|uniref:hypothetical protein n=1 Tax=Variovorax sp. TBS-050B TaxID=2940551 RepID=UPI002473A659|nr:hypothetical protein [Variovorax sp. TBS-050B]MDH6591295.1 hypothetical protein [Variovorax sp. TBS-050B]